MARTGKCIAVLLDLVDWVTKRGRRDSAVRTDCDGDVILLAIAQEGGIACHTGRQSCFFHELQDGRWIPVDPVLKDPKEIYAK